MLFSGVLDELSNGFRSLSPKIGDISFGKKMVEKIKRIEDMAEGLQRHG
jgi:hypothetical protein